MSQRLTAIIAHELAQISKDDVARETTGVAPLTEHGKASRIAHYVEQAIREQVGRVGFEQIFPPDPQEPPGRHL